MTATNKTGEAKAAIRVLRKGAIGLGLMLASASALADNVLQDVRYSAAPGGKVDITLQFANPALSWGYDDDQATARATRLKVFREAAEAGTWIAGAHLGRPGIGRVVRKGEAFAYEPAA